MYSRDLGNKLWLKFSPHVATAADTIVVDISEGHAHGEREEKAVVDKVKAEFTLRRV